MAMRTEPSEQIDALNQIAAAASADLLAGCAEPYFLHELLARLPDPTAAAVLDAAVELAEVQSGVQRLHLRPLLQAGAAHPHWWVRRRAARDLYEPSGALRRLLADPSPAVVAQAATHLPDVSVDAARELFRSAIPRQQAIILAVLCQLLAAMPSGLPHARDALASLHADLSDLAGRPVMPPPPAIEQTASAEEIAVARLIRTPTESEPAGIFMGHPDPLARQVALDWLRDRPTHSGASPKLMRHALQDPDPMVLLAALASMRDSADPEQFSAAVPLLLELTGHPCRRVIQAAAGSLRRLDGTGATSGTLRERLVALSRHGDPLTRVQALMAFRNWHAARSDMVVGWVRSRWETEPEARVRLAAAETLRWLLDRDEWLATVGVTLLSGPWKKWAWSEFDWIAQSDPEAVLHALPRVRSTALRRRMQSRLEELSRESAPSSRHHRAA